MKGTEYRRLSGAPAARENYRFQPPAKIRLDKLYLVISQMLDAVEQEFQDVSPHHCLRVAMLCSAIARHLGICDEEVIEIGAAAIFHDSAISESHLAKHLKNGKKKDRFLRLHCKLGQRNFECLPVLGRMDDIILYHHERNDGSGPFGKKRGEFPIGAEILSLVDTLDITEHFETAGPERLEAIRADAQQLANFQYSQEVVNAFCAALTVSMCYYLHDENIEGAICRESPSYYMDLADPVIIRVSEMVAHIIDNKSVFTRKHTVQIANRAYLMAEYYGYSNTEKNLLYLAASLHDIGKAATPTGLLEKPGNLTLEEYRIIMKHVRYTWEWLHEVEGFEQITHWAATHHERIDGSGYPFHLTGDDLDFNARLMACIDIYQAVSEERPYHAARCHRDTMHILRAQAAAGKIDAGVVEDMDIAMAPYSMKDVPSPPLHAMLRERRLRKDTGKRHAGLKSAN